MIYFKGLGSRRPFHGGIGLRRARGFYLEWHPYWISFRFPVKLFLDILLDALSPPTEVTWFAEVIFAGQVFLLFVMGCLSVECECDRYMAWFCDRSVACRPDTSPKAVILNGVAIYRGA